jgi:hypothetical protein
VGFPLGLLVVRTEQTPGSIDELIDGARTGSPVLVPFGAFWLAGTDRSALDREVGAYIGLFREALGPDPARVDLADLRARLVVHEEQLERDQMVPWLRREAGAAWEGGRWAQYVRHGEDLASYGESLDQKRLAHASGQLTEVLPPPAWPPTVDGLRLAADRLSDAKARLRHAAGSRRDHAALQWLAFDRLFTPGLIDAIERLRFADPAAVEPALVYLEADPWAFRTGYVKERIMSHLRRCPMDDGQQARLRSVLLHLVDVGDRREYALACRLAYRAADPVFMEALRERTAASDPGVARRARRMLASIRPPAGT